MPNPFPGMDPYLEGDLWTAVHTDLCAEIARQLSPRLRPKYVALSTRRVVLAPPDEAEGLAGQRFPDIGILPSGASSSPATTAVASARQHDQHRTGQTIHQQPGPVHGPDEPGLHLVAVRLAGAL